MACNQGNKPSRPLPRGMMTIVQLFDIPLIELLQVLGGKLLKLHKGVALSRIPLYSCGH